MDMDKTRLIKIGTIGDMGEYLIDGFASTKGINEELFFKLQKQIDKAVEKFSE